jgi:uncharacterized protein
MAQKVPCSTTFISRVLPNSSSVTWLSTAPVRILIAGISTRALAQSAQAGGYTPVTLDYFGDFDQRVAFENYSLKRDFGLPYGPPQLLEASRRLHYDGVVYTASLENHPAIVTQLAPEPVRLLGNDPQTLVRIRDGVSLFGFMGRLGRPAPRTYAGEHMPPTGAGGRWLHKPKRSGGGHDIRFWPVDRRPGSGYLLQEFVSGPVCSAAFLANGREALLLGLTEQLIGRREFGARGFTYCGNLYPWWGHEPAEQSGKPAGLGNEPGEPAVVAEVRAICALLTQEFRLVGLNGLDFVFHDGRVWPLEVNPRYSASMELIEWAARTSLFAWHVQAALTGHLPGASDLKALAPASPAKGPHEMDTGQGCYGKAILYAEQDCRAPDTRRWTERLIRDVPFPGDEIAAGEPICTILARGASPAACYAALVAQAAALKGELYA